MPSPMPVIPPGPEYTGLRRIWNKYRVPSTPRPPADPVGREDGPGQGSVPSRSNEGRSEAIRNGDRS